MSRPGITYHEVASAAQELTALGKNPTIENVRSLTGTGSSTTIARHLKTWINNQDKTRLLCLKENLPEEIVLTMKGLWERVINQGEEKIAVIKQDFDQVVAVLREQNKTLEEDSVRWQRQYHQTKQEKDSLTGDKLALEQIVRQLEIDKTGLTVAQESMAKQLQEKQDRVEELHRLNRQVQANLEHYREASQEQRRLDQERHEQRELQLEQHLQLSKQELAAINQQKNALQREFEQLHYAHQLLQQQHEQLAAQHGTMTARCEQFQKEAIEHAHAEKHWQDQYHQSQKKCDEQNTMLVNTQTQIGILSQKLSDTQAELKEMGQQNQFLAHEKWIISQEKAQLLGQLNQLEKIA